MRCKHLCMCGVLLCVFSLLYSEGLDYRSLLSSYGVSDEDLETAMTYMGELPPLLSVPDESSEDKHSDQMDEILPVSECDASARQALIDSAVSTLQLLCSQLGVQELSVYRRLFPVDPFPAFGYGKLPSLSESTIVAATLLCAPDQLALSSALALATFLAYPDDATAVGNAAFAMQELGLDADQVLAYAQFAVQCSLLDGRYTHASLRHLLHWAQYLVDYGDLEQARSVLRTAYRLDRSDSEIITALAAVYQALGQTAKARTLLASMPPATSAMGAMLTAQQKLDEQLAGYANLPVTSKAATLEPALQMVSDEPITTAADFVQDLNPQAATEARKLVSDLSRSQTYRTPDATLLTQYASAKAVADPLGASALEEFARALALYGVKTEAVSFSYRIKQLENLGVKVTLKLDPQRMFKNPRAYEGYTEDDVLSYDASALDAKISEVEQTVASAVMQAQRKNYQDLIGAASAVDPASQIFLLDPKAYADENNVRFQQQNYSAFLRIYQIYLEYMMRLNAETAGVVGFAKQQYELRYKELSEQQQKELDKAAEIEDPDQQLLAIHRVHTKYLSQFNAIASRYFSEATNAAVPAYKKISNVAQDMYQTAFAHALLISDPSVRSEKELMLRSAIMEQVQFALSEILNSYSGYAYFDSWDCGCSFEALQEARNREQEQRDALEKEQQAKEKAGKRQFASKEIPPASPLFAKLDAYGTDLSIPFIPTLRGRISCARTTATFTADFSRVGGPNLEYTYQQSAASGAATHSGGISMETLDGKASLSLHGSVSLDGNGVVSDYQFKSSATLSVDNQAGSLSLSAEAGYGSTGGFNADAGLDASVGAKNFLGSAQIGYKTSVIKEGSLTSSLHREMNPLQSMIEDVGGDEVASVKPLWSGLFTQ
ncbi:tetratricopeptide repeat protein [Sphaerochaeta sp.]|uniref:tetratricopeptide repeat protein n=1 Tax=Sphaerochaeta sp. TaxID=1972642 RepID=UPI002FCA13E9